AQPPVPDPLTVVHYSCIYWVDHLEQYGLSEDFQDASNMDVFLRNQCLYWLEAISLLRSVTEGIMLIQKLKVLLQSWPGGDGLMNLVQDIYHFIRYHRGAIEDAPLQVYGSALVFSPPHSMIKQLFKHEWPYNIDVYTGACLQTLEGHYRGVNSVVFSYNSSHVASGLDNRTIKIWDAYTGGCLQMLEGHSNYVHLVVFSHDSSCVLVILVVFSHDSSHVVSRSDDKILKIWDVYTGAYLQTLKGYNNYVRLVMFSHDSSRIVSRLDDKTIKIWDTHTSVCLQTIDLCSIVYTLFFDATGSSLYTDTRIITLSDSLTPAPTTLNEDTTLELQSLLASQPP
ncbi:Vegetative incompatibility protein HET-E-1, partial [Penicillium malachiteum]